MNKAANFWNGLPPQAKGTIAVIGTLVIIGGGIYLYTTLHKSAGEKTLKDAQKEADAAEAKGLKLSYPLSQYKSYAESIYDKMKQCVGDDYGGVKDLMMKMNNDLDVLELMKAYGTPDRYCFGVRSSTGQSLLAAVRTELGSEFGGITSYRMDAINADWAKKGITYKI